MNTKIIGLSGTNGSGKDTVGKILAERYGYLFLPLTDLLRTEAQKRGLEPSRENLRSISAEWRQKYGLGNMVRNGFNEYEKVKDQYKGVVMASMRQEGEADEIHNLGGVMVWVDADPRIRYERVQANAASRGRSAEDNKTFEEFLAEEEAEMHRPPGADPVTTLNMAGVKDRCDIFIENNGSDIAVFQKQIESALGL